MSTVASILLCLIPLMNGQPDSECPISINQCNTDIEGSSYIWCGNDNNIHYISWTNTSNCPSPRTGFDKNGTYHHQNYTNLYSLCCPTVCNKTLNTCISIGNSSNNLSASQMYWCDGTKAVEKRWFDSNDCDRTITALPRSYWINQVENSRCCITPSSENIQSTPAPTLCGRPLDVCISDGSMSFKYICDSVGRLHNYSWTGSADCGITNYYFSSSFFANHQFDNNECCNALQNDETSSPSSLPTSPPSLSSATLSIMQLNKLVISVLSIYFFFSLISM